MNQELKQDLEFFSRYMALIGAPTLDAEAAPDPQLQGKKLGIVNGATWITPFANYFGRKILPGVKLINAGNEAVQLNFMDAHRKGLPCPPQINIDLFVRYSEDLVRLFGVDAILISCSTMNRAAASVREAMKKHNVPVVQIDEGMMEEAVSTGGRILVIATHGPTVRSTQELLKETAARLGREVSFAGATVEEAFHSLGRGDVEGHNQMIAAAIREAQRSQPFSLVVLAQLSMAVFKLSYPDPVRELGVRVLTSAETGFERVKSILKQQAVAV